MHFTHLDLHVLDALDYTIDAHILIDSVVGYCSCRDALSKSVVKCSTKLTPMKEGDTEIIAGFWSKELSDLTGTAKVKVTKKKEPGVVVVTEN